MVESITELRKICYKGSSKRRPLYMELVTMKLSIYVTKLLLFTKVRADHVSIFMILSIIFGSLLIGFGSLWVMFLGITLIHFTIILDNVNGEVARYRKEGSLIGSFLEETYHVLSIPFVFFFFGYGIFNNTGIELALLFGFISALFASPIILNAIKIAVVKKGLDRLKEKKEMLPERYTMLKEDVNIEGGSTKSGRKLYSLYEDLKELWGFPANFVHIHLIIIFELFNSHYGFIAPFLVSLSYILIYGSVSFIKQFVSFIVHYRGRTIFHYYNALFKKR